MGFFTRKTDAAINTAHVQESTVDTTIHYKDLTNEELDKVINDNISLARDTDPNLEVIKLTRDNPKDSELLNFIIDEIRLSDATDDTIKTVVKTAVQKYNARIESEEKEKHNMAEENKAEETTAQNAETQEQPKAAKEKGAWKKTAKKVAKIALPIAGGIAAGVIGTELAIKKPWAKSKKSSSAPRPAAQKPAAPAKK